MLVKNNNMDFLDNMTIKRGQFVGSMGVLLLSAFSKNGYGQYLSDSTQTVDSISLYLINVSKERNFSHGTWENRQHVFVKIQSGKHIGWAEALANKNNLDFDIQAWGLFFNDIKGMSIGNAIKYCHNKFLSGQWEHKMSEPALMGLYDLLGKLANQPTIELWGLHNREPVPGLFCILEKDVKKALVQAAIAQDQKLTSHVKLKLFGINEIDLPLIKSLRKFFGQSTFLTADANRGYKNWKSIDELAAIMNDLHVAGLDAMEDPASLSTQQWIELQAKVGNLALIPDYPMRPAYKALQSFSPEMGRYFNIHPDTMGTFTEVIELGKKIKKSNRGLMIGDSSFVGPACTFWQQLAIGLGASWVEALEKPQESNIFQQCVKQQSTNLNSEGKVVITTLYPGFGIQMDEAKLKKLANKIVQIF